MNGMKQADKELWDSYWELQEKAAKKARTKRAKLEAIKRAKGKR
jgi:hypothetical protein